MFKMEGCGACDMFFKREWQILTSDPQFYNTFDCIVYQFGGKNPFNVSKYGNMVREVPFFAIKMPNGKWISLGTFKENRSVQHIKKTAMGRLNH
jgi:hypothetical protein